MAIVTATNSTSPNTVKWATSTADPYELATQLRGVAENFDLHDHSSGKGLPIRRIQTSATPAASSEVQVTSNRIRFHDGTAVRDLWAVNPPAARAFHNANQSINNTTATTLAFNSERFDTDTIHDTATNNSRLTCKTAGKYLVFAHVQWASGAGTYRQTNLFLNGATNIAIVIGPPSSGNVTYQHVSTVYDLAVNDYVEIIVQQDSGGALNVVASGNASPEFGMVRVG